MTIAYTTESASHAWRTARRIAAERGYYLEPLTTMAHADDIGGDGLVIVSARRERVDAVGASTRWATVYRVDVIDHPTT